MLLPKFEQQCARRMAQDLVARGLLPMNPTVRIVLCQDGRQPATRTPLTHEASYFRELYSYYLRRPDITVEIYSLSFGDPPETMQQNLRLIATTDIFYMTGFSRGQKMSQMLLEVFQNHARIGSCERDESNAVENLVRAIVARVQYNEMLFIGTCGGASCGGEFYWDRLPTGQLGQASRDLRLFDLCMGVSLHYDSGSPPSQCDTSVINYRTVQITSGAALALHIEGDIVLASSFPCGSKTHWVDWCAKASVLHQRVVEQIARDHFSGPWYHPCVGTWYLALNGEVFFSI